ncbi:MAG: hypothetical protein ACE5KA_09500 [Nitrososphaerales archaeon]
MSKQEQVNERSAHEQINRLIEEEVPTFLNGRILSDTIYYKKMRIRRTIPVPIITPFFIGMFTIPPGKKRANTVTYHRIPLKSVDFELHLLVYGYMQKEGKRFEILGIQAGALIDALIEHSLIATRIKLGIKKRENRFIPIPPVNDPPIRDHEEVYSTIFKEKKYWNDSVEKLNDQLSLLESINGLSSEVTILSVFSSRSISFPDKSVGVGCLVASEDSEKRRTYAVFQTVPNFVRDNVKRHQALRMQELIGSIDGCSKQIGGTYAENPDPTFWEECSATTMLKHLKSM